MRNRQHGQAIVEFAILAPVLFAMLGAMGQLFWLATASDRLAALTRTAIDAPLAEQLAYFDAHAASLPCRSATVAQTVTPTETSLEASCTIPGILPFVPKTMTVSAHQARLVSAIVATTP